MSTSLMTGAARPARRRRAWTAAEKAAVLRAFTASGQSATAFCRARGVPRATLTLWRRTAGAPPSTAPSPDASPADTVRFARVEVVATAAVPGSTPAAPVERTPLTLALRTPGGLEAMLTGLDAPTTVTVLRGVFAPGTA